MGVALGTNHRWLVANPSPNPNPRHSTQSPSGRDPEWWLDDMRAWPRGHVTALDQSQRQHCVAKRVARRGAHVPIILLQWHINPSSHLATTDMGRKLGAVPLWGRGSWVPIQNNVARVEAYVHANFHLDSSNRLARVHQRYKQDRQDNGQIA